MSGGQILDRITVDLLDRSQHHRLAVYIDVYDLPLSRRWLTALNQVLTDQLVLEKNYCFFGFADSERNGAYILDQVNRAIEAINQANLDYEIRDHFTMQD